MGHKATTRQHPAANGLAVPGFINGEPPIFKGKDVLDVGLTKVGQAYVIGTSVPLDNAYWKGPWDCAEFASWCVYQAYEGMRFGFNDVKNIAYAEPFSGAWYAQALKHAKIISIKDALAIPGAVLLRKVGLGGTEYGHVAFCMGDGEHILEARGKEYGVNVFSALHRPWSFGCMLPDVDYGVEPPALSVPKQIDFGPGYLWLKKPPFKGCDVLTLQKALNAAGINPGPSDGVFGTKTHASVVSFQVQKGLTPDGIVGPQTAKALSLSFPITPAAAETALYTAMTQPAAFVGVTLKAPAAIDGIAKISETNGVYTATTTSGFTFKIGRDVGFPTKAPTRRGLANLTSGLIADLKTKIGAYRVEDYAGMLGQAAYFIAPTLATESGGLFGAVNSYDRAAFTFGAPQLAAHTPNDNFIEYFRLLLARDWAAAHFPEFSLRDNGKGKTTVHLAVDGGYRDMEVEEPVQRATSTENQLTAFMHWINPEKMKVDANEASFAARMMNLVRLHEEAKLLQLNLFLTLARGKLRWIQKQVPAFNSKDWREALWVMDIRHHGRGGPKTISKALSSGNRLEALAAIGKADYAGRIKTVQAKMAEIEASGVLTGFDILA